MPILEEAISTALSICKKTPFETLSIEAVWWDSVEVSLYDVEGKLLTRFGVAIEERGPDESET